MSRRRASTSGGVAPRDHKVVAYGAGGLAELTENILPDDNCFILLSVIVGSGALARAKSVFFVWSGPDVGAIKRSKVLTHKNERIEHINGSSVDFNADSYDDITPDAILEILRKSVTIDDGDVTLTHDIFNVEPPPPVAAPLKEEPETVTEEVATGSGGRVRQTGDLGETISLVRQEHGGLNWAIMTGDPAHLKVVDRGMTGLVDMIEAIKDGGADQCYYGLCQLIIGKGAGRKVKHVLIVWIGESLGAVKKGKASSHATTIENEDLLGHTHFSVHAMDDEELTTEIVIEKLKAACVDDDLDYEISFEEVANTTLEVEAGEPAVVEVDTATSGGKEREGGEATGSDAVRARRSKYTRVFKDVIDEVKDQDGQLNWAMFL